MDEYLVYIRVDDAGRVVDINSSAFLQDTDGWTQIDSGHGDKFHHAQGNYFPLPLFDERGIYRYKFVNDQVAERTVEEMDADYTPPEQKPTAEELLAAFFGGVKDA